MPLYKCRHLLPGPKPGRWEEIEGTDEIDAIQTLHERGSSSRYELMAYGPTTDREGRKCTIRFSYIEVDGWGKSPCRDYYYCMTRRGGVQHPWSMPPRLLEIAKAIEWEGSVQELLTEWDREESYTEAEKRDEERIKAMARMS